MSQLVDQVFVLVFVVIVDEVLEMIVTSRSTIAVLELLFVEVAVELERCLSWFNIVMSH